MESIHDYVDEQILNNMTNDIFKMPERVKKGLPLVYKEKQIEFLQRILEIAKESVGYYLDDAIHIMELLDKGYSIEEIVQSNNKLSDADLVRSFVLEWSKRGVEYFLATIPFKYEELPLENREAIEEIDAQNRIYHDNEIRRNSGIKK